MPERVALIGVGIMGQRMCGNLLKAGFPVVAFDLNPAAMEAAAGDGLKDQTVVAKELERLAGATLGTLTPER